MMTQAELADLAALLNKILSAYSEKDWNYSLLSFTVRSLDAVTGPYALWCDFVDVSTRDGERELKRAKDEVTWGDRHSSELGILELISLRLNKTLLSVCDPKAINHRFPVIRLVKTETLRAEGQLSALWYEIREVSGEDFENR